jgi:hypothetical protein
VVRGAALGSDNQKAVLVAKPARDKVSFFVVRVPFDLIVQEACQKALPQGPALRAARYSCDPLQPV